MGDALALVEFAKALADAGHEVDPLLDILPGSILGKLLDGLQRYLFGRHGTIIQNERRLLQQSVQEPSYLLLVSVS